MVMASQPTSVFLQLRRNHDHSNSGFFASAALSGDGGTGRVGENYVAVQVGALRLQSVFVTDKAGKTAIGRAIISRLRRSLEPLPTLQLLLSNIQQLRHRRFFASGLLA